jgi:outer membrane protein assembly factor BamD (BamD/ComL family)
VTYSKILLSGIFAFLYLTSLGQVGVDYDLTKPKKWENRVLASETSNNGKKFRRLRHFIQDNITHYNFYYNSNEKVKGVVARAKLSFKEDYSKLLPFYNYTLDATAAQKKELDSVIYKCTMGILIHDTRNDWIDNLYLLMGETYYLKKQYDSAFITFQFINWAFAPKESDGYAIPIGSNYNADAGGNNSIVSTKEKQTTLEKVFELPPPSRNDALLWKIRTYLAKDDYIGAASLIQVLDRDPQFPPRLQPSLQEEKALYFYKQNIYDSAAYFLERALPAAGTREEAARWEYLIAQLYERLGNSYEAKTFYERVIAHTYDPILEIYARLNAIRQNKEGGADYIQRNIAALVKMAHKDRFESYRDIIYYTAAQMELERHNIPGAITFLNLCTKNSARNGTQRDKAFLQLGNLSFEAKDYRLARGMYDSINMISLSKEQDVSWLPDRKAALTIIVAQMQIMYRQDSLQRIANLSPPIRDAYLKRLAKYLRKQQGLRDQEEEENGTGSLGNGNNKVIPDLFSSGSNASAADWYFNNQNLKARGYSDFKSKWGNRPDVDNWQVSSIMKSNLAAVNAKNNAAIGNDATSRGGAGTAGIDYKSLLANLPTTPEKLKKSNDSIEKALFLLGKTYQEGIADYSYAINTYDSLLSKFPDTRQKEEALLNMYYCYKKLGDEANAARILDLLKQQFPKGSFTAKAVNPDSANEAITREKVNATHQYENIYNAFIEGRFDSAIAMKKVADSLYGNKYWTPQLLYIESVYFIRTRQDQQARVVLSNIIGKFPHTPMADKAATLLDVLNRRRQIEDYLTHLEVKKATDDDSIAISNFPTARDSAEHGTRLVRNDSNMLKQDDTSSWAKAKAREQALAKTTTKPTVTLPGMIKVDSSSGANTIKMDDFQLAALHRYQDSLQKAMAKASADSTQQAVLKQRADSVQAAMKKLQADTAQLGAKLRTMNSAFALTPDKPHSVIIVMNKVDPVYVSEARNAFNGYNQENFYSQSLTSDNASLSDSVKLLVISGFPTDADAMTYVQNIRPLASRTIVPWLPADKYTFIIISATNLSVLMTNKDMNAYRKFLSAAYPGKF